MTTTKSLSKNSSEYLVCFEDEQGDIILEWSDNHPLAPVFSSWSQEDFMAIVKKSAQRILENGQQTGQGLPEKVSPKSGDAEGPAPAKAKNKRGRRKSTASQVHQAGLS